MITVPDGIFFQKKALGSVLYERVCDHLDLLEKEFFGLTYRDPLDGTLVSCTPTLYNIISRFVNIPGKGELCLSDL